MALEYRRRGKRNLGKGRMFDREGAKEVNNPREFRELPRSGRGSGIGRGGRGGDLGMGIVINDTDPNSTFFRITEFPEYLGVGKNTIRLLGSNLLKKNSKIDIEVLDSQGNPIYYEIPKVKKSVKGKIISIWVYSGRSNAEENTASGTAKVTIVGTGNRNEIIRWTRNVEVRANEESSSEIIFDEKILPLGVVSSSLQPFSTFKLDSNKEDDLGQGRDNVLSLTTKSFNTKYQRSNFGDDVVITKTSGDAFTSEMVGGEIRFDLSSQTVFPRQTGVTQPTEFTSSVLSVSSSNILQIEHTLTGSKNHQYYFTDSATIPTDVVFFSSASVGQSQNLQTVATFTLSNVKPIAGEVHTLRTSVKSRGLGTEFEIIGTNAFDSKLDSFDYTVPIPSQHIGDPKTIKIEFLNKKNEPSATFILLKDIVFPGSTTFIGGKGSLITGSIFISNALGSGIEIGGASSGFIKSVGYSGFTSASTGDGPGGFLIYSGSGNLVIGSDLMEGVGFEFVSANDTSHMKFTTSGSGELDIKAEKFFIGTPGSQFISGSGGAIEISSSDFHLDPVSNQLVIGTGATIKSSLTVNQIRTPAIVNGAPSTKANASSSIDQDGFARFASASIAGFEVVSSEIRSSDRALRLKAAGDITASRVLLEGGTITDGVTILGSVTANSIRTPAEIAGNPSTETNASSSIRADGFARFVSASIGGWDITTSSIEGGNLIMKPQGILQTKDFASNTKGWKISSEGNGTAEFENVRIRGTLRTTTFEKESVNAVGGQLWIANATTLTGSNITANATTMSVKNASGFTPGEILIAKKVDGTGFQTEYILVNSASIDGDNSGAEEVHGRLFVTRGYQGPLQYYSGSALGGGSFYDGNSASTSTHGVNGAMTSSITVASSSKPDTWEVFNDYGYNKYVYLRRDNGPGGTIGTDGFFYVIEHPSITNATALVQVAGDGTEGGITAASYLNPRFQVFEAFVSRSAFLGDLLSTSQSYDEGQVIVSTGVSGSGYIRMNANPRDSQTPYIDIVERTGSGLYDQQLKVRLGDLTGLANSEYVFGSSNPGFGLATDNVFLQGGIIAKTGSIAGIKMESGKLFIGVGNHGNSDTGFYVDSGSQFSLGDKFIWQPTTSTLTVRGTLQFASGQDVQQAVNEATASNTAKQLSVTLDSQVFAFDDSNDTTATPNVINFTISQQNLSDTIATGDITITKAGGATISTPSLGGTSNVISGSGQQSGSLSFSGLSLNKTDLPLTIAVSKDTLSDSISVVKVQGGADGTDGADAVTAFLTNESHTFPANSSGVVSDFSTGVTDIVVFEGITNKTSNYSFSGTGSSGVSFNQSTDTFTITAMSHDSGSLTITAVSSSTQLVKTMSLAKSTAGSDGAAGAQGSTGLDGSSAKSLVASVSSQVFAFDDSSDTTATPGNIIFSFNQQNLNAALQSSDITITTQGGSSVTGFDFNNTNVTNSGGNFSGIASGSIVFGNALNNGGMEGTKSHFPLTISATKNSLTDTIKIFKVEGGADGTDGTDGTDAVTAFLTNEAHTFAAQSDGTIVSFADASSEMIVFEGVTDSTANYTYSRTGSAGVTSTLSGANGNVLSISALGHDSGSVVITAVSASTQLAKTMSLVKSKQGTAGLAGSDAKILSVTVDSQVFAFDDSSDTSSTPSSISFVINQQNLSAPLTTGDITITKAGGGTITTPSLGGNVVAGSGQQSGSVTFDNGASPAAGKVVSKSDLPITIAVAKDSLSDDIKVFKVEGGADGAAGAQGGDGTDGVDGTDAVTAFLTNENHTLAADSSGNIASFDGAVTDMEVFEGVTNKNSSYTFERVNGTGVTSTISSNTVTVTGLTHDSGSITITATSASVSLSKTMSLAKSKQGSDGQDGTSAKLLAVSTDSPVFGFLSASDNSADPANIIFSINQQNLSGTIGSGDISITTAKGGSVTNFSLNSTDVSNGTGIVSGSVTFTGNTNAGGLNTDKTNLPITISVSKDSLSDEAKVFKVEGGTSGTDGAAGAQGGDGTDGVSALSAFLSNDSHTLPLSSSNQIISFAGASTDIFVFQGVTDVTNDFIISKTQDSHITTTLSGDTVTITNATAPFSGSVVITAASASTSLSKTMSLQVARQGDDGTDGTTAKLLSILSDTPTFAFDNAADTSADPSSANITINQQNLSGTVATGDITITKAGGSTFTTPSLGGSVSNGSGTRTFSLAFSSFSKTDLPLTVSVSKDSLSDTLKIFKVQGGTDGAAGAQGGDGATGAQGTGGADGTDGTSALTAFLTNDSHTLPLSSSDNIISFAGASTDIIVFQGVTDVTDNFTISRTSDSHITTGLSGDTVTITGATTPFSGSVVVTAASASVTLSKTMSVAVALQGDDGADGADGAQGNTGAKGSTGAKGAQGNQGSKGSTGAKGATGAQGADNQDFDFLASGLSSVPTPSPAGLVMNADVFGYHNTLGSGPASISDFSAFMDSSGNFYLGSGSGALGKGYFAWDNTEKTLLISGSGVDFAVQEFYFGRGLTSISGSNGNIKISGDVELVGRNTPNSLYFEDFSQAAADNTYTNQSNDPKLDGTGFGFYKYAGGATPPVRHTDYGQFFGNVLEVGNNSGDDEYWGSSNTVIPFNPTSLYEIEVRVKKTAGSGNFYCGVTGYKTSFNTSNGQTTLTKVNNTGTNSFSSQHYFAASGVNVGSDWTIYKGYFKGTGTSGNGGQHNDITDPGTLDHEATAFAPMFIVNYDSQAGITLVDYIKVTEFQGGGGSTTISGDAISAGTIKSNNIGSNTGTILSLDNGKAYFGGYGAYTDNNGVLLDGPNAQFAVGRASGNYMRFNHTAGKLEVKSDNFTIAANGDMYIGGTNASISSSNGEMEISSSGFILSGSGDARFFGTVSGSTILGGTIGIGSYETGTDGVSRRKFYVTQDGAMYATTASISGDIVSDSATLGKFTIDESSITASGSRMVLDAENYNIILSDTSLTPLVNINAGSSLQSPQAGSTITEYKYAGAMSTLSGNASGGTVTVSPVTDYPHQQSSDSFYVSVATNHQFNFTYIGGSSSTQCKAKGQGSYAVQILYLEIHGNSSFTDLKHTVFLRTLSAYGWDVSSGESDAEGLFPEGGIESVVGDTDMLMGDGSIKKAKDIKEGDNVCAWDDEYKKYNMISEITSVKTRLVDKIYRVTTESGKSVDVSETHGFYITKEEEIHAHELIEGESKIFVKDGDNIKLELVTSLEIIFGEHQVYTFSVPGLFNYISNNIVSHNTATGPQEATTSLAYGFSKSTTLNMTNGTKYYRFRRYYYARAQYSNDGDNSDRTYSIKTDLDSSFQLTPLTQGTEINNAGLQVNKSNTKVFRVDMSSVTDAASRPIIDVVGGMRIDYFQPYNSTADGGLTDKTYNQYNSNINYNERAYPLTRFVGAVDFYNGVSNLNSGGASGHANIGVASLTRSSEGYGYITLEQYHAKKMTVAVGGYRETATLTANESSFNFATRHNGSTVYFVSKDNDKNNESDADYFSMVGIG